MNTIRPVSECIIFCYPKGFLSSGSISTGNLLIVRHIFSPSLRGAENSWAIIFIQAYALQYL
uniref:Uncharacterized protein n=1 Tax=Dulem virus 41 TaxID=3145759 RepID=A0AAU8AZN7_9CAUD